VLEWLGLPVAASAHAGQVDHILVLVHWLMVILFVGWGAFFAFVLFRFRSRRNPKASYAGARGRFASVVEVGVLASEIALLAFFSIPFWSANVDAKPPDGAATIYFYSARDAYRTEGQKRTDLAVNYNYKLRSSRAEVFGQLQVINLFNNFQLCACGGNVFQNGGAIVQTRIDTVVRTNVSNPTLYSTFNPFTTTPVEGVNWAKGPNFGTALNRFAYTSPQQLRLSFGIRF